ncbi:MAG: LytR/AlgR family response regulator transcription factor [Gammaproteobacteria bacterium]
MRILIADDETPARARLRRLIAETGAGEIVGESASGRETLAAAKTLHPDLVLLDIRMPEGDGIAVAGALAQATLPPAVIFVTALADRALAAFEAGAAAYLVKPVARDRLAKAVARASRPSQAQLAALRSADATPRTHLAARLGRDLRLIPVADVLYFRAEDKSTVAILTRGEVVLDTPLTALEHEFGDRFVRVRRNLLIARAAIQRITRDEGSWVELVNGERLPVARRHRRILASALARSSAGQAGG